MEHVPYEHGREYVESIQQYEIDKDLIESFKENDKIGGANVIEYDEPLDWYHHLLYVIYKML